MDRLNHLGNDYVDLKAADISIGLKVCHIDRNGMFKDHTTVTKINSDGTYNITKRNDVPLTKLKQKVIHILPSSLCIADGVHDEGGKEVVINISISIVGESREHCVVIGGLNMQGKKEDDVNVSNLTLRDSKGWHGVNGCSMYGASIHLDNVSVENCGHTNGAGVAVHGSKRNTMKNCNVSKMSWILLTNQV